jgi:hypothetical protein
LINKKKKSQNFSEDHNVISHCPENINTCIFLVCVGNLSIQYIEISIYISALATGSAVCHVLITGSIETGDGFSGG